MLRKVRFLVLALALVTALGPALGCRSTSTNVTGPSSAKCALTLAGAGLNVPGDGGTGSISVTTNRECTWTASSANDWLTVTSGTSGQGPGAVAFRAAENPAAVGRTGVITVGTQRVEVQQQAATCSYVVTPPTASISTAGGNLSFEVAARDGCGWTAQAVASWTSVTQGTAGSGNGTVVVAVAANGGASRSTTLAIAGRTVTLTQAGASCSYLVSLTSSAFGVSGGTGVASVSTAAGCQWSVSSNQPWITLGAPSDGSGGGTVSFAVAANSGSSRSATLTVAGQGFTITQASGQSACRYGLSPGQRSVGSEGGVVEFDVDTTSECEWTATSNASWLSVVSGAGGLGRGRVAVSAAPNTGAVRSATVSIGGGSVTVIQGASACTFAVAPTAIAIGASGGPGSVAVTTSAGCEWAAASNVSWVSISGGGTGAGPGTVSFTIAANAAGPRDGALVVAGQTVAVTQAGATCTYTLAPTALTIGAAGGSSSVAVTAPAGCAWAATSGEPWISISGGASGSGSGTVSLAVGVNTGAERAGTLSIAGQPFIVTQSAAATACAYVITPRSQSIGAGSTSVVIDVSAAAGCAWTTVSNAAWITVAAGASGSGNGTVTLAAAGNTATASRDGTATIAGQTFTLTQAGAGCSYALSPSSASVGAAGNTGSVDVTTAAGCGWTASSNAPWLGITSGSSGTGGGRVSYLVTANTDVTPRSGSLTIAGLAFAVTQAGVACSYAVAPTTQSVAASGGNVNVTVTTSPGCAWTASSSAPWLTISTGTSGSGSGTVTVAVAVNTSGAARTGGLTIAGQSVTINQQ